MEVPERSRQFASEGPTGSIETVRELLQGHCLIKSSSESCDHQFTLVRFESVQPGLVPRRKLEHPETYETGPQITRNDEAMIGAAPGGTPLQESDLLVGFEGDSTIKSGFDLTSSGWIKLLEGRPHHVDAE